MSGSRLGRGRSGRLAVYGGCGVVVVLLVILYRAATSEMTRLRELHVQCAHQQEALAAQLQVIFEYKMRLEKSLAEEKNSNAAVKQDLQQRATREKSLRDKDSVEAMQRFSSLQQTYKLLQTEHLDLKEECKKQEKQALEDTKRLEATLQDLRSRIRQSKEEKDKSLENLKTKYLELETEKTRLEEKYQELLKNHGNADSTIEHLQKKVIQLKLELEDALIPIPPSGNLAMQDPGNRKLVRHLIGPSQQQQVSPPNNGDKNPQPLHAPIVHHAIGDPLQSNEQRANDETNEIDDARFAQRNENIVPVGPDDPKEIQPRNSLPLPYDMQQRRQKKLDAQSTMVETQVENDKNENPDEEQLKYVIPPPNQNNERIDDKKSSPKSPGNEIPSSKQNIESIPPRGEKSVDPETPNKAEEKLDKGRDNGGEIDREILNEFGD